MASLHALDEFLPSLCGNCFYLLAEHVGKKCLFGPTSFTPYSAGTLTGKDWLRYVMAVGRYFRDIRYRLIMKYSPRELDEMGNPHEDANALVEYLKRLDGDGSTGSCR